MREGIDGRARIASPIEECAHTLLLSAAYNPDHWQRKATSVSKNDGKPTNIVDMTVIIMKRGPFPPCFLLEHSDQVQHL